MSDISVRIKEIRETKKLSQVAFAAALKVTSASISFYENGKRRPDHAFLETLTNVYGINVNWLLTGEGDMFISTLTREGVPSDVLCLPVLADIAAGIGIEAEDLEPSEYISIPRSLAPDGGSFYCFRVQGVSMEPELHTGDYAIISAWDFDQDYDGSLCAFRSPDGLLIKRLVYDDRCKRCLLIPLNPTHKIIQYNEDSPDLQIIGRLIAVIRKYDL